MGLISKIKTWVASELVSANDLNGNFDIIYQAFNGNIDNTNIKTAAGIAESKIAFTSPPTHSHQWKAIVWSIPSYLYVDTSSPAGYFRVVSAKTLTACYLNCAVAPTGAALIVDIEKSTNNGQTWVSLWTSDSNRPTISAGSLAGSTTTFGTNSVVSGELLRVLIKQVGSTVPAANLTVELI